MSEPIDPTDQRLAETLFALFLARTHKADRELFDRLCRAHPELRDQLESMYRAWSRMRDLLEGGGRSRDHTSG